MQAALFSVLLDGVIGESNSSKTPCSFSRGPRSRQQRSDPNLKTKCEQEDTSNLKNKEQHHFEYRVKSFGAKICNFCEKTFAVPLQHVKERSTTAEISAMKNDLFEHTHNPPVEM